MTGSPLADALQWHLDNGVEVAVGDTPVNRLIPQKPGSNDIPAFVPDKTAPALVSTIPAAAASIMAPAGFNSQRQKAVDAAKACMTLEDLQAAIRAYDGLEVKRTATNLVFADGNRDARVMIIGEAPGADEDRQGLPFVGVSGQLLDKMFDCIGLNRKNPDAKQAIYISNILNWRPPGNRTPTEAEMALALPFIERHIAIVRPQFLVLMGAVAAKTILNMDLSISKLRGKVYTHKFITDGISDGLEPIESMPKIIPTYHPAFLLRTPTQKRKAWQDLLLLAEHLK